MIQDENLLKELFKSAEETIKYGREDSALIKTVVLDPTEKLKRP